MLTKGVLIMDIPFELILLEECQPFLDEFKKIYLNGTKLPLRRGMAFQPSDHITKIKVNKNRTPTNTNIRIHNAADQWFLKTFGVKARSQAFFCTSSKKISSDYGFSFFVFPVGKFDIIWSRRVDDLFMYLRESTILKSAGVEVDDKSKAKEMIDDPSIISDKLLYDTVATMLDSADYVQGKLDEALASKNEIMVLCDYYYVAEDSDEEVIEFIKQYIKGMI